MAYPLAIDTEIQPKKRARLTRVPQAVLPDEVPAADAVTPTSIDRATVPIDRTAVPIDRATVPIDKSGVSIPPLNDLSPAVAGTLGATSALTGVVAAPKPHGTGWVTNEGNIGPGGGPSPRPIAAPNTAMGRVAAKIPTILKAPAFAGKVAGAGIGALGMAGRAVAPFLPAAGGALAVGGEALGVADTAADPATTKLDVYQRGAEGVGRVAGGLAGAGIGAAAGATGGPLAPVTVPLGAMIGGAVGYAAPNLAYAARDWWRNRGDATPGIASAAAAPASATTGAGHPDTGADNIVDQGVTGAPAAAPANIIRADMPTDASAQNLAEQLASQGQRFAIRGPEPAGIPAPPAARAPLTLGPEGGPTTSTVTVSPDGRTISGVGATQATAAPASTSDVGVSQMRPGLASFLGNAMRLRQIAGDNAQRLAASKQQIEREAIMADLLKHGAPSGSVMAGILAQAPHLGAQTALLTEQAGTEKQKSKALAEQDNLAEEFGNPATTPARRRQIQELMLAKHGKDLYERPIYNPIEGSMGQVLRQPLLLNRDTGQYEPVGARQEGYPDGTQLTGKDGKQYIVKNGVPVLK